MTTLQLMTLWFPISGLLLGAAVFWIARLR